MKPGTGFKKNFLRFYLDPELLTEKEAEEALRESGVNIELLRVRGENFIKKLEAKAALKKGAEKKEEFLQILEQFRKEKTERKANESSPEFRRAARKQSDGGGSFSEGEVNDAELLEKLKKKDKK